MTNNIAKSLNGILALWKTGTKTYPSRLQREDAVLDELEEYLIATSGHPGIVELATNTEAAAGSSTTLAVTPAGVAAAIAGADAVTAFATNTEAAAKSSTTKAINPANLAALDSSTTFKGFVELATTTEAVAGTSEALAVTPAGVAAALTTAEGLTLASDTVAQAKSSTTVGVSPGNLAALDSSTTFKGFIEIATTTEAQAGTDSARALTAEGARQMIGSGLKFMTFTGAATNGACTAAGLAVNDVVLSVVGIDGVFGNQAAKFEGTVTVTDQIQQTAAENLSANHYAAVLYRPA